MKATLVKVLVAVGATAGAGVLIWNSSTGPAPGEQAYFYDVSEKQIYVASKDSLLPHTGVGGAPGDGYRACVLAPKGDDAAESRTVAYIETYSPAFAQKMKKMLDARAKGEPAPDLSREEVWAGTLMRRLTDADWVAMDSTIGVEMRREWMNPGPDGRERVVCDPK
jgi:hypothetical protein